MKHGVSWGFRANPKVAADMAADLFSVPERGDHDRA
jgi:hypothetical protein